MSSGRVWGQVATIVMATVFVRTGQAQTAPPALHAAAAILLDATTGKVLFARNPDKPLPPASTTKIATGMLLARDVSPEQPIKVSPNAARVAGHALGVRAGETLSADGLLYAVLLASANDASEAAAEHIAGDDAHFAARMNEEARKAGATHTHFVNPHGLPANGHVSTARDLALLARSAMQVPRFARAVATRTYAVGRDGGRASTPIVNQNDLLGQIPGMDGVKTGYTDEAGYCFVGSATRHGRRLITVVLHSSDWRGDTRALLEYGFAQPATKPQAAREILVSSPRRLAAGPADGSFTARSTMARNTGRLRPGDEYRSNESFTVRPTTAPFEHGPVTNTSPVHLPQVANSPDTISPNTNAANTAPVLRHDNATDAVRNTEPLATSSQAPHESLAVQPLHNGVLTARSRTARVPQPVTAPSLPASGTPTFTARSLPQTSVPSPRRLAAGTTDRGFNPGSTGSPTNGNPLGTPTGNFNAGVPRFGWRKLAGNGNGWLWLVLLLALAVLARKGGLLMRWPVLAGWKRRRRTASRAPGKPTLPAATMNATAPVSGPPAIPPFRFTAPILERRPGSDWLTTILDNAPRLLEPFVRRHARAVCEADPCAGDERVRALLSHGNPRLRVVGAELLAAHGPLTSEESLLALIEDEQSPPALRSEAVSLLAEISGNRHERLWTQMLLRDGSPPAARVLAALPRLSDATLQALNHVLKTPRTLPSDADVALRLLLRDASIACVLSAHGAIDAEERDAALAALPENHRYEVVLNTLAEAVSPEAGEKLVETALRGPAHAAMQALISRAPYETRDVLDRYAASNDHAARTRARILRWLLRREGDKAAVEKLAGAGNDMARGALQLARLHRWDASQASPDALVAAAQIVSLRLGYTPFTPEQIAQAFRKVSEDDGPPPAVPPALQTLANAYAHPHVYDAVQTALHTHDGLGNILATLAHQPQNAGSLRELSFWANKTPRATRLTLLHTLAAQPEQNGSEERKIVHAALAERANDHCPLVRGAALRALHARPMIEEAAVNNEDEALPVSSPATIAETDAALNRAA